MKPLTALEKTIATLTEEAGIRLAGPATFSMGRVLADSGAVTFWQFNSEKTEIIAKVKGGGLTYTCWISQPGKQPRDLDLRCACSIGSYCKHVLAALWKISEEKSQQQLTWRDTLDNFLAKPITGQPLALVIETTIHPPEITVRRKNAADKWVATRASWTDLTSTKWKSVTEDLRIDHLKMVRKIWNTAQRSLSWVNNRSISLTNLEHRAWKLLQEAEKLGIELFLDDTDHPLEIATEEIDLRFDAHTLKNGDLELIVVGQYAGQIIPYPQVLDTHPALVKFKNRILIPVAEESNQLVEAAKQQRRIVIPQADHKEYEAHYLPYLSHLLVADQTLHGPYITAEVELADYQLKIDWQVRYENETQTLKLAWFQAKTTRPADQEIFQQVRQLILENATDLTEIDPERQTNYLGIEKFTQLQKLVEATQSQTQWLTWNLSAAVAQMQISQTPAVIRLQNVETLDREKPDWFNLEVVIEVGDQLVSIEEVFKALANQRTWVKTESGIWVELDLTQIENLRALLEGISGSNWEGQILQVPKVRLGMLTSLEHYEVDISGIEKWITQVAELVAETPERTLPKPKNAALRPYQIAGSAWLDRVTSRGFGAILADDMGLGKTLQILTVLEAKRRAKELKNGVVVVAPTSVLQVWADEAKRFYPQLQVTIVRHSKKKRSQTIAELLKENDVLITSWNLLQIDAKEYQQVQLDGVVFDEAQAIKNPRTSQHKAAKDLQTQWKIASTGTPIENSLSDLWAIMRVINPGLLPGFTEFNLQYGKRVENYADPEISKRLQALIQPFMKRRTKTLVAPQLPAKIEQIISVQLEAKHRRLYERYLNQHRKELLAVAEDGATAGFKVITGLNQLRQLALDPALVEKDAHWPESAKTKALLELLLPLIAEGKKSLVFSQYTAYLQRVKDSLTTVGIEYTYLDGSTQNRQQVIENFRKSAVPVFLISLKAGGTGLTLTEAENVFILDPWWNPATENQAIDRAHRIGQNKTVNVYRLCAEGTIEEKVMALQEHKRIVAEAIVGEKVEALKIADLQAILS
ncbi:DEAD/DEAH box helicase [Gleimia sp. 6138-11-ORH1]|uniref:DEAD/DEAH box helicase n=1 Tax=Gleimia sp. 6138-11-ORH1 TaxID=2973937 RepID=UPI002167A93D|nr:DEAD/DEAH box helicase [Gleimia sp. 6138-11-ORH1]MCS4484273.1 DEAD/DEAH box helicase [Gleimia sp. 6138-11-ORH1]